MAMSAVEFLPFLQDRKTPMPYWRLSAVYFCYFAVVGVVSPYWGLYLASLGYKPAAIGLLSAIPMLTKLAAPNIWGALADYTGQRMRIIRFGAAGACLCFAGIFFSQEFMWLVVVITAYSFFWNAILAQFEVVTLSHLCDEPHRYSRVRLWGSVGFIVAVVVLGYVFEWMPIGYLPLVILLFLVGIFISTVSLPVTPDIQAKDVSSGFISILVQPVVVWFFLVMTLLQVSHGVYYTFYSIFLEMHGYSRGFIGILWAIGVVAEILIFLRMPKIFEYFSAAFLLKATLLLTAIRWAMIGLFPAQLWLVTFVQVIHAFSFGVSHALAIEFVRDRFRGKCQGQGQAFYSAACFGGGNAIGSYVSGLMWGVEPLWAFLFSVFVVLAGLVASWRYLPDERLSLRS